MGACAPLAEKVASNARQISETNVMRDVCAFICYPPWDIGHPRG